MMTDSAVSEGGTEKSQCSSRSLFTDNIRSSVQKAKHVKQTPDPYITNLAVSLSFFSSVIHTAFSSS